MIPVKRVDEYCGVYEGLCRQRMRPALKPQLVWIKRRTIPSVWSLLTGKMPIFSEKGSYLVDDDMLTLKPSAGEKTYYRIEKGQLRLLNQDKEPITGALAEHYILKKVSGCK